MVAQCRQSGAKERDTAQDESGSNEADDQSGWQFFRSGSKHQGKHGENRKEVSPLSLKVKSPAVQEGVRKHQCAATEEDQQQPARLAVLSAIKTDRCDNDHGQGKQLKAVQDPLGWVRDGIAIHAECAVQAVTKPVMGGEGDLGESCSTECERSSRVRNVLVQLRGFEAGAGMDLGDLLD